MTHQHAFAPEVACTDLAPDVCIRVVHEGAFTIAHDRPAEEKPRYRCEGTVPYAGSRAWAMTGSLEGGDLSLTPSILCSGGSGCGGSHGYVTDGKWAPV